VEHCANCRALIGQLETPYLWGEHVVCGVCYRRLAAATPLARPATTDELAGIAAEVNASAARPSPRPSYRRPPAKYVDHLRYPRLIMLLAAILFSVLPALNYQPGSPPPDYTFAWILWAAWVALGLASIIKKASWKERQGY
jgi:hypothetical protein